MHLSVVVRANNSNQVWCQGLMPMAHHHLHGHDQLLYLIDGVGYMMGSWVLLVCTMWQSCPTFSFTSCTIIVAACSRSCQKHCSDRTRRTAARNMLRQMLLHFKNLSRVLTCERNYVHHRCHQAMTFDTLPASKSSMSAQQCKNLRALFLSDGSRFPTCRTKQQLPDSACH